MEPTIYIAHDHFESDVIDWLVDAKEAPVVVKHVPRQGVNIGVPPFYHDYNVLIHEFWSLVEFLQERYPGEQLMPLDPVIRAQMRQACHDIYSSEDLWPELQQILGTNTPYLAGKEFTLVDLFAGVWMRHNGIEYVSPGLVLDYYHRLGLRQ
jgi:glutathione S-transferase